jgi:hypothetical protein
VSWNTVFGIRSTPDALRNRPCYWTNHWSGAELGNFRPAIRKRTNSMAFILAEAKLTVLVVFSSMIGCQRSDSLDCPPSRLSRRVRPKLMALQVFSTLCDQPRPTEDACARSRLHRRPASLTIGMLECRKDRTDAAHSDAQPGPRRDEIDTWSSWVVTKPLHM